MKIFHIVALLLALAFFQGLYSAVAHSSTTDEPGHLRKGYVYLTTGKWVEGLNNPPLSSALAAIPFLLDKNVAGIEDFQDISQDEYILQNKETYSKSQLVASRLVPLLFMVGLCLAVYLWTKELYNVHAGLLALFLCAFSPNILSFGSTVTADIGGVLFIFLSLYTFWRFMYNPSKQNLIFISLFFGLAQVTKLLAVFLIPFFIISSIAFYFLRNFSVEYFPHLKNQNASKALHLFLSLSIIFLVGLFFINAIYFFDGSFTPLKEYDPSLFISSTFKELYSNPSLNWIPLPFPQVYVLGHDLSQWQVKDEVRGYFFWGKIDREFPLYFIGHILIKTPISLFILLLLSFFIHRKITWSEAYILFYIVFILIMMSFFSKMLIGYRHILSIYPLLFVLCGKVFNGTTLKKQTKLIITFCLVWYLISSLLIAPHYLEYFNEMIGGPKNGYKYTIDSNLDWEQDWDFVKKYLEEHNGEKILLDPGCVPFTGKALIPANSLQFQKALCYQWLKQNFEPVDYIGYSWLVYNVQGEWKQTENGYIFMKKA